VTFDCVLVLFRPVRPLPNVVPAVAEVDRGIFDREDVGMVSGAVEDVEGSLQTGIETDDDVVVDSIILMVFLYDLEPARCYVGDEVSEFVDIEVDGLRVRQEKAGSICTRFAWHSEQWPVKILQAIRRSTRSTLYIKTMMTADRSRLIYSEFREV